MSFFLRIKNYFICKVLQLEFKVVLQIRISIHFCHPVTLANYWVLTTVISIFSSVWLEICAKGPHSCDMGNVTVLIRNGGCGLRHMAQLVKYLLCKSEDLSVYIQQACEKPDVIAYTEDPSTRAERSSGSLDLSDHRLASLNQYAPGSVKDPVLKNKVKGNWRR